MIGSGIAGDAQHRGRRNFHAGHAAEDSVARFYQAQGHEVLARRWRGQAGEIDLVLSKAGAIRFVEVKAARSFARAAESLQPRQIRRLARAAEEFLATQPDGQMTECAFDVGLVDDCGATEIIENAMLFH